MSSANQLLSQSYVKVVWCHDVGGGCRAVDSAGAVVLWWSELVSSARASTDVANEFPLNSHTFFFFLIFMYFYYLLRLRAPDW